MQNHKGWVVYTDVFAFGSYLKDKNREQALIRLRDFQTKIIEHFKENNFSNYFLFSDTLIFWKKVSSKPIDDLPTIVDKIKTVQRIAANQNFILRGAATFGELNVSQNFILGEAYIRSYIIEEKILRRPIIVVPKRDIAAALGNVPPAFHIEEIATKDGSELEAFEVNGLTTEMIKDIAKDALATTTITADKVDAERLRETWTWLLEKFSERL